MHLSRRFSKRPPPREQLTSIESTWKFVPKDRGDLLRLLEGGFLELVAFALSISLAHAEQLHADVSLAPGQTLLKR